MPADSASVQSGISFRLRIRVPEQTLEVLEGDEVILSYPISTSRFGLGFEPGSLKTPTGRFVVSEKIGADAPPGAVFKSREPTGEIAAPGGDEDLILTRILRLDGLDPDNANTRERFIYIHGTNQESLIGVPASHGCVRMKNADIIDLFDRIPAGTPVRIET